MGTGGYFLVIGYWGCAARLGRIFKAELTIMGLYFQKSYSNYNGMAHFWDLGDQKDHLGRDLKMGRFLLHFYFKFNQRVYSFQLSQDWLS